jgi:biopolymer transport protein ExbD
MKFERRLKPNDQFSLASIADIVFLLLIYFMVTASFVTTFSLKVDLPQSTSDQPSEGKNTVTITRDNVFSWNDKVVAREEIPNLVRQALNDPRKESDVVTLRTDKLVTMEDAAFVITAIAENKGKVIILTEREFVK